jgi:hypothetical protein
MISFNLVIILIGIIFVAIVAAWLSSARLRKHVEHPKHELVKKVEHDHGTAEP